MKELSLTNAGTEITQFDPERYRLKVAALEYGIEHAKRIKDWPAAERAVEAKIEEQLMFVAWWEANVTRTGPRKLNRAPGLILADAEKLTRMKQQRVSDLGKRLADPEAYRAALLGAAYQAAMLEPLDNFRAQNTGNNEWSTPREWIERARAVMGGIDLDPATSVEAQKIVQAKSYFTKEDDGLRQPWYDRVWLNPLYAKRWIALFTRKMVQERLAGRVTAGIMLTHNHTDTAWFQRTAPFADAICFTNGRVKFYDGIRIASCAQGQAFFYFGDDVQRFAEIFGPFGLVYPPPMRVRSAADEAQAFIG
jgi:ParB family chromosome partitioning protein